MSIKTYGSYRFRTKDPVVDELRTLIETNDSARVTGKRLAQIERQGGPSSSAMRGWFFGKTRRPQSASVEAAGRAIGYMRVWQKVK